MDLKKTIAVFLGTMLFGANAYAATCDELVFGGEVAATYPNVGEFCQEVVERDGVSYAKLHGRVTHSGFRTVGVQFEHPDGTWGDPFDFTPASDFRVRLDGRDLRVRDLQRRQQFNVYLREGATWHVAMAESDPASFDDLIVVHEVVKSPEEEQMLPKTATLVPLVGTVGFFLFVSGLLIRLRRKHA